MVDVQGINLELFQNIVTERKQQEKKYNEWIRIKRKPIVV